MVKKILLPVAFAALLSSCGSDNYNQVQSQQIDSAVNAKVKQHDAENAAKNDSTLKAIEMEKAEAIANERREEMKRNEKKPVAAPSTQVHTADTVQGVH